MEGEVEAIVFCQDQPDQLWPCHCILRQVNAIVQDGKGWLVDADDC